MSPIKKQVQRAPQFHFAIDFDRAAPEALPLQRFPDISLVLVRSSLGMTFNRANQCLSRSGLFHAHIGACVFTR